MGKLNRILLIIFTLFLLISSVLLYLLYTNQTDVAVINSFTDEEAVSYSKDELDRFFSFLSGEGEIGTHVQIELIQGSPQKEELRVYNSKYPFADYNSTTPPSEQDTYEIEQGLVGCTQPEKVDEKGKEAVKIKFYIAKSKLFRWC